MSRILYLSFVFSALLNASCSVCEKFDDYTETIKKEIYINNDRLEKINTLEMLEAENRVLFQELVYRQKQISKLRKIKLLNLAQ